MLAWPVALLVTSKHPWFRGHFQLSCSPDTFEQLFESFGTFLYQTIRLKLSKRSFNSSETFTAVSHLMNLHCTGYYLQSFAVARVTVHGSTTMYLCLANSQMFRLITATAF